MTSKKPSKTNQDYQSVTQKFNHAMVPLSIFVFLVSALIFYGQILFYAKKINGIHFVPLQPSFVSALLFILPVVLLFLVLFWMTKTTWQYSYIIAEQSSRRSIYYTISLILFFVILTAALIYNINNKEKGSFYPIAFFNIAIVQILTWVLLLKGLKGQMTDNYTKLIHLVRDVNVIMPMTIIIFCLINTFIAWWADIVLHADKTLMLISAAYMIMNVIWLLFIVKYPSKFKKEKLFSKEMLMTIGFICSLVVLYSAGYQNDIIRGYPVGQFYIHISPNQSICRDLNKIDVSCEPNHPKKLWVSIRLANGDLIVAKDKKANNLVSLSEDQVQPALMH